MQFLEFLKFPMYPLFCSDCTLFSQSFNSRTISVWEASVESRSGSGEVSGFVWVSLGEGFGNFLDKSSLPHPAGRREVISSDSRSQCYPYPIHIHTVRRTFALITSNLGSQRLLTSHDVWRLAGVNDVGHFWNL